MFEILGAMLFGAILEMIIKYWWQVILGYMVFATIFWAPFIIMEKHIEK